MLGANGARVRPWPIASSIPPPDPERDSLPATADAPYRLGNSSVNCIRIVFAPALSGRSTLW
jgi:hypothetical protein